MLGTGWKPASEPTLRIAPARRSTIGRTNASVSSWTAATLTCTIAASVAGATSSTRAYEPKPALLHRPATNFSDARTDAMSVRRCSASARSVGTASASMPCSAFSAVASCSRRSPRRATRTRSWPSAASWRASSAPMPDDAPVTSTTWSGVGAGRLIARRDYRSPRRHPSRGTVRGMDLPDPAVVVALLTPYEGGAGGVDAGAMRAHVDWLVDAGVDGIMPCGTTGEGPLLADDEVSAVVRAAVAAA